MESFRDLIKEARREISATAVDSITGACSNKICIVMKMLFHTRANGAAPILFATWAYQRGGAKLTDKGWDYDEMAQKLSEAYHKAALENNALIADVGRRFYEWSDPQDLYAADGVHPSELGSHIAAETIAAVIRQHEKEAQ